MRKNLLKNSAWVLAILFIFYSTWVTNVFWDFFRTIWNQFQSPTNSSEFAYWYGYGSLGWGYWYGYWYGYGNDAAWYYTNLTFDTTATEVSVAWSSTTVESVTGSNNIVDLSNSVSTSTLAQSTVQTWEWAAVNLWWTTTSISWATSITTSWSAWSIPSTVSVWWVTVNVAKSLKLQAPWSASYIVLNTTTANVSVSIPTATTILAPSAWNWKLKAPKIITPSVTTTPITAWYTVTVDTSSVVEFWWLDDNWNVISLLFDKPVKVTVPWITASATKVPAYLASWGSSWNYIETVCTDIADRWLTMSWTKECYKQNWFNLDIYTLHATSFWAVNKVADTTSSSSGGGGGWYYVAPKSVDNIVTIATAKSKVVSKIANANQRLAAANPKVAKVGNAITKAYNEMYIFNTELSTEFANNYSLLVDAIVSGDKEDMKKAVALFKESYKEYLAYKKANIVKKTITISGKKVNLETPVYKDVKFSKSVEKVNAKIVKLLSAKLSADKVEAAINSYNKFLLALKVWKEWTNPNAKTLVLESVEEFKSNLK